MRKLTAITTIFCLIISFSLTACGGGGGPELPKSDDYTSTTSKYSYKMLETDEAKHVYDLLETEMNSDPDKENTLYKFNDIDQTQFYLGYRAYTDDHPEVFWDKLGYLTSGLGFTVTGMCVLSRYSKEELKEMKLELNEEIEEFLDAVPSGSTPEELEKFTHDYLIDKCEYDFNALDEIEKKTQKN